MELQKICIALLALMLAAMVMVPLVSAADEQNKLPNAAMDRCSSENVKCVSIPEAQSIAVANVKLMSEQIDEFANWDAASVQYSTTYYDLDNQITAYSFKVLVDGGYDGYILTSATTRNYPVLALSRAKIPDTREAYTEKTSKNANTVAKRKDLSVGEVRPIYLGGLAFLHEYILTDSEGNPEDVVYIDVRTGEIAEITDASAGVGLPADIKDSERIFEERQADIERSWSLQRRLAHGDDSVISGSTTRSLYTNTVSGVPLYFWRTGCSPTAAAMVLGYWQSHGYFSLPTGNTLIDELASAMGTSTSLIFPP